jgi:hypothetical protein
MRCLLTLCLSACSTATWTNYDLDESVRPGFLKALRNAQGEARLVAGDRCYVIHATALQAEIRKLTSTIADTIAERGSEGPQGDCMDEDAAPVVGYTYVDRALSVGHGEIIIRGIRTDHGSCYWVEAGRRRGKAVLAEVAGTPAIDDAWTHLVAAASERAGVIGPVFLGNWDIDESVGVNVVGTSVRGSPTAPPGWPPDPLQGKH